MLGLLGTTKKKKRKGKSPARRRPSGRGPTGAPRAKPGSRPPAWKAHGPDALGLAVLFGAILMALSLADSAGPVGRGIDWVLRGAFGDVAVFVPLGTLLVSLAAFIRREEAGRILVGT
ncbi:MAG TPA: hypothetical protein VNE62_07310, partial [Actinomycetota bacterium]|nr:hypothetical protein [Actinomycetota bacterium]